MDTAIDLAFADGVYTFHLGLAQIKEIQTACGDGIGAVYARLLKGRYLVGEAAIGNPLEGEYRIDDIVAIIQQGLIGGGAGLVNDVEVKVTAYRASQLVENYVLARGCAIKDSWALAVAVATARIEGYTPPAPATLAKEPKKKAAVMTEAGSTTPEPSPTAP